MNKRQLAPMLILFFSVMAVLPETSPLVHAQGTPTVSVSPAFNAGDIGSTFQVAISLDGVANLIGYDVQLQYNTQALSVAGTMNCVGTGTAFGSAPTGSVFTVACSNDAFAGLTDCSAALLGGVTADATTGASLCIISFTVLAPFSSALTILNPQIIILQNGGAVQIPVSVVNGTFLSPPVLSFISPNAQATPNVVKIHKSHVVTLSSTILLDPNAPFNGFGGVTFTIVPPGGGTPATANSNIAFIMVGQSTTVTASFDYFAAFGGAPHTGTYQIFATLLRCPLPDQCATGATAQGLSFRVKH